MLCDAEPYFLLFAVVRDVDLSLEQSCFAYQIGMLSADNSIFTCIIYLLHSSNSSIIFPYIFPILSQLSLAMTGRPSSCFEGWRAASGILAGAAETFGGQDRTTFKHFQTLILWVNDHNDPAHVICGKIR